MISKNQLLLALILLSISNLCIGRPKPEYNTQYSSADETEVTIANSANKSASEGIPFYGFRPFNNISIESPIISDTAFHLKSSGSKGLPEKYDLRNVNGTSYVTTVKNQAATGSDNQQGGNCWAFASIAAIESNWKLKGFGEYDLSEQNMASCHGFEWKYGDGGNSFLTLAYLSRLQGPVSEMSVPYNTTVSTCIKTFKPIAYIPESRMLYKSPYLLKQMIMDYGAVTADIFIDLKRFYNDKDYTYISGGYNGSNHQVAIIGWDDTKMIKFNRGAWIVKNSWGTSWGENGFFYISYRDANVNSNNVSYPKRMNTWEVDKLFSYTELGTVSNYGYNNNTAYGLIKFTSTDSVCIKKIGTFVTAKGTVIDIDIYKTKTGNVLSDTIATLHNNICEVPGYYTFDIPVFVKGDFYVKVKYYCPLAKYPIPVEEYKTIDGSPFANPFIEKSGKQWISADGLKWDSLGSNVPGKEKDIDIRVYTVNKKGPKANFNISKNEICIGSNITFTDSSIGNITKYSWDFGLGKQPRTIYFGKGPWNNFISDTIPTGLYTARLIVEGEGMKDTIYKDFRVVDTLRVDVTSSIYKISTGDTIDFICLSQADSYKWTPTTNLSSSNSSTTKFSTATPGVFPYTVSVTQGNCQGSTTFSIKARKAPANDKICNAIELKPGKNGPFTNINATVDAYEPSPEDTSCYKPMSWCDEGGLQNSVWFKFTAGTGKYSTIISEGMDTQLALYRADLCTQVVKDSLKAANDDFFDKDKFYAAAIQMARVVPGKTYYVQMDGSGGGVEDTFYLYLQDTPVNIENIENITNSLSIYPIPNNGNFNLSYSSETAEKINIQVYDITGKLKNTKEIFKTQGNISVPFNLNLKHGIYIVKLRGTKETMVRKFVVE